jgi:hypothetical protein
METLRQAPDWGTSEASAILKNQTAEFMRAGIYDSYADGLRRIDSMHRELDKEFKDKGYQRYDPQRLERTLQLDWPLLAVGIDEDGLLARYAVVSQLGLAKVDPGSGQIAESGFLWPIADVTDSGLLIINDSFTETQLSLIAEKNEELRQARLYVTLQAHQQ